MLFYKLLIRYTKAKIVYTIIFVKELVDHSPWTIYQRLQYSYQR